MIVGYTNCAEFVLLLVVYSNKITWGENILKRPPRYEVLFKEDENGWSGREGDEE